MYSIYGNEISIIQQIVVFLMVQQRHFAQQIYAEFDCPEFYESLGIDFDEGIFLSVLKWLRKVFGIPVRCKTLIYVNFTLSGFYELITLSIQSRSIRKKYKFSSISSSYIPISFTNCLTRKYEAIEHTHVPNCLHIKYR